MTPAELTIQLREALKVNQTELARRLNQQQSVISEIESGKRSPSLPMVRRAAGMGGEYRDWARGVIAWYFPDAFDNKPYLSQLTLQNAPTLETTEKETQS